MEETESEQYTAKAVALATASTVQSSSLVLNQ